MMFRASICANSSIRISEHYPVDILEFTRECSGFGNLDLRFHGSYNNCAPVSSTDKCCVLRTLGSANEPQVL